MGLCCVVCGRQEAAERRTTRGDSYGPACDGLCDALSWDAHWQRAVLAKSTDERDVEHRDYEGELLRWEFRRQRATRNGLPFSEPYPKSPAEKVIDAWIVRNGLEDIARELE